LQAPVDLSVWWNMGACTQIQAVSTDHAIQCEEADHQGKVSPTSSKSTTRRALSIPRKLPKTQISKLKSEPNECFSALNRRKGCFRNANSPLLPGMSTITECHQHILLDIISYSLSNPSELCKFCGVSATLLLELEPNLMNQIWSSLYKLRWPALHDFLTFRKEKSWRSLYKQTLKGSIECILEVHDRQKKIGFAMSAMPATVVYEHNIDSYVATYLSASAVPPEVIPTREQHRIRFCPASVCGRLQPGTSPHRPALPGATKDAVTDLYPYKVLQGIDGLVVGGTVELQWKMQLKSPFAWWFGKLESLRLAADGGTAVATVIFTHFRESSRWYRLTVHVGGSEMRPCSFGGYTGGLRAVDSQEAKRWAHFFPKEPMKF